MLNRAQNALYWREWSVAKRALTPGRERRLNAGTFQCDPRAFEFLRWTVFDDFHALRICHDAVTRVSAFKSSAPRFDTVALSMSQKPEPPSEMMNSEEELCRLRAERRGNGCLLPSELMTSGAPVCHVAPGQDAKGKATSYASGRFSGSRGEIHVFDDAGENVVDKIPVDGATQYGQTT